MYLTCERELLLLEESLEGWNRRDHLVLESHLIQGTGIRVWDFGFGVWCLGFGV